MEAALSLYPVVCAKFDVHYFQECLVLGSFNFLFFIMLLSPLNKNMFMHHNNLMTYRIYRACSHFGNQFEDILAH